MLLVALTLVSGDPVEALYRELRSANSATAVLQRRCGEPIRALRVRGAYRQPSVEQRVRLAVSRRERVAYRLVRLVCGDRVLSVAENWYVPARLTPAMRSALQRDVPFGVAIRPFAPVRANLASDTRWPAQRSGEVLRHRAVVRTAEGSPIAEVSESYRQAALSDWR